MTPPGSRLSFVRADGSDGKNAMWICRCSCGNVVRVRAARVRSGFTKSCGCLSAEVTRDRSLRHGMTRTPTYQAWNSMIERCDNPNNPRFSTYGERGIKVCERWHAFESFLADMGKRPDGLTIDRIDNDRGYEPGNCRWATRTEQARNKTTTKLSTAAVEAIRLRHRAGATAKELGREFGVSGTMIGRVVAGKAWR